MSTELPHTSTPESSQVKVEINLLAPEIPSEAISAPSTESDNRGVGEHMAAINTLVGDETPQPLSSQKESTTIGIAGGVATSEVVKRNAQEDVASQGANREYLGQSEDSLLTKISGLHAAVEAAGDPESPDARMKHDRYLDLLDEVAAAERAFNLSTLPEDQR